MGLQLYEPTGISHPTSVDFSKRSINQPVHLVQYDKSLPILAVSLYNNGQLYPLPDDAIASIRLGKPDKTFVYNRALGCNSNRTVVYFEVTQQMTLIEGEYYPLVEITREDKIANSSSIYIIVDRNPVQHDYIESTNEFKELVEYRNEAITAAQNAKSSETNALQSEQNAETSASNALDSATAAGESEKNALNYMNAAKDYADNASTAAATAADDTKALLDEYAENARNSADSASISESNSDTSAKLSQSYAVGGSGIRDGEDTDNSKYYKEQAEMSASEASRLLEDTRVEHTGAIEDIVSKKQDVLESIDNATSGKLAEFHMDLETGHLLYTGGAFNFTVNNGHLNWEVAI